MSAGISAVGTSLDMNFDVFLRGQIGRLHHEDPAVRVLLFSPYIPGMMRRAKRG